MFLDANAGPHDDRLTTLFDRRGSKVTVRTDDQMRTTLSPLPTPSLRSGVEKGGRSACIQVKRATIQWVDSDNAVLRIPKQDSSKTVGNWTVPLSDRTATALSRWIAERDKNYPVYGDYEQETETEALWLTRQGNSYSSQALNTPDRQAVGDSRHRY